jgi:hypothetical protein
MQALSVTDERRRARLANFGSLSAGLVVRGTVPAELLTPVGNADLEVAEPPAQPPGIVALANRRHAERMRRTERARQDPGLLEAERKRPRESNFASLTGSMVERGKVSRDILTAAQVDLLLQPEPVEMQQLLGLGEQAPEAHEPTTAIDHTAAAGFPASAPPPPAPEAAPVDRDIAAGSPDLPKSAPASLYIVRTPDPLEAVAQPDTDSSVPARSRRTLPLAIVALVIAAAIGGHPSSTYLPPVATPAIDRALATEAEAPDQVPPAPAEPVAPEVADQPGQTASPAAEATEDDAPTPVAPVEIRRWRPGAAQGDPQPESTPAD